MNPNTPFWNKQIKYFEEQTKILAETFDENIKIGEMRFEDGYCYIDIECDNRDLVNMLRLKMINFQFFKANSADEIFVEVSIKRGSDGSEEDSKES